MSLDRSTILSLQDLRAEEVEVPGWGKVFIRCLTGAERDALEAEFTANKGKAQPNFRGRFAALVLSDAQGVRLFSDKDAVVIGSKSAVALNTVLEAGMRISGLTASEASKLVGESASGPSAASGSDSP